MAQEMEMKTMDAYPKKLIEVALPLPEINDASAYDKMPGIGPHPKGIHHWWARLPLPVARAVLFASVVDDPSSHPERFPTPEAQDRERERLFSIIRRLMQKQLHKHPEVYAEARTEMLKHCGSRLPAVIDPFSGGGSIPLEAARLGLEAHAGDLNPVAVLLNKCNLELAPLWADRPSVNPEDRLKIGGSENWRGTTGLAADVRYYGRVILDRARQRIGHHYPPVEVTPEMAEGRPDLKPLVGKKLPVIAWIWARTVRSPNPAAKGAHVPLMSTFWLSSKKGSEAWLEPVVDRAMGTWRFAVRTGAPREKELVRAGTKTGRAQFRCILTGDPISDDHIKAEGQANRLSLRLTAIVAGVQRGRTYVPADMQQEQVARVDGPADVVQAELANDPRNIWCVGYGLTQFSQLFTPRQLTAMVTLSDLVKEIREDVRRDALAAGLSDAEADRYTATVSTFLALALGRSADHSSSLCTWNPHDQVLMHQFGRQALPMTWDFAEGNVLSDGRASWAICVQRVASCLEVIGRCWLGSARQVDAATGADGIGNILVSTDPPYYDNIGYAALSDFFYVWLRRTIGDVYPDLFSTVLVPKSQELTASPERFDGGKQEAKKHFETGFRKAFAALREKMNPEFPLTVYYAFKQDDEESGGDEESEAISNNGRVDLTTGWETMLEALVGTGFQITATWPVRASQAWRMRAMGSNALASYIVLACRPRPENAPQTDRRSFIAELKRELPAALRHLQQGNVAPVDFAQAAIGPGMAIYSRYSRILEASGRPMSVRTALALIDQTRAGVLSEEEDEFDSENRWSITWYKQNGFEEGEFGDAELLSKAKATSVAGLVRSGIVHSRAGKVRLLRPEEPPKDWDPASDQRLTNWELTHHLLRVYCHEKAGEVATAELLRKIGAQGELARDLAYRLFDLSERKNRSQEAQAYNALVLGWPEIARLARAKSEQQGALFES
jgi:putative DNA methylase